MVALSLSNWSYPVYYSATTLGTESMVERSLAINLGMSGMATRDIYMGKIWPKMYS